PTLWKRRTTIEMPDGTPCDLLALPDLVRAKKTQRDKDWPMIRRLVEAHYFTHQIKPNSDQIAFWFRELRTPELLIKLAKSHPEAARRATHGRKLLSHTLSGNSDELQSALTAEEQTERSDDRAYWQPLKQELERLRRMR
ncbi:MAG: hypothetical protein U0984_10420, partial [Prosthecobacter sp.]|nr:hypothetical protein [Prosthecobacter sp.]